jgi:hypothetical protein
VLLGANEQTSAVLLAVPFGVAWLATGAALLLGGRGSGVRQRAAVPAVPPGVDVDRLP